MKLGEILVQKQLIDKAQLKEALEAQLIFGGHLGTCLMELGYPPEQDLASVLAEAHEVGMAPPGWFESVPKYVTSALNDRLVEKHQAVPFRLQDKGLDVAMVNPKDLLARDELSFASGYKIRSWVSPEARIFQAMERYYDIPRRLRYVTLCKEIDKHAAMEPQLLSSKRVQAMREAVRPQPAPEAPPPLPARKPSPKVSKASVLEPPSDTDPLGPLAQRLMRADTVDEVTELALEHASHTLERCLFFMVRSGAALPWQATGFHSDPSKWESLSFPITSEPIFGLPNGEDLYRGPIPRQTPYKKFFEALGLEMPGDDAVILPAHADDRLVAIFYGDGGVEGRLRGNSDDYRRLVKKTALALSMVQVRRKILSV